MTGLVFNHIGCLQSDPFPEKIIERTGLVTEEPIVRNEILVYMVPVELVKRPDKSHYLCSTGEKRIIKHIDF